MIGNDVVDVGDPETRAAGLHPRFDARVFALEEQEALASSADPDRQRWILWAAKESAYKAARRCDPRIVFSPSRFIVRPTAEDEATVSVGDRRFRIALAAGRGYVHAVACVAGAPTDLCTAVATIAPDAAVDDAASPSIAARELAAATVGEMLGQPPSNVTIRRHGRLPALWLRDCARPLALSLSHHGRFVAFACAIHRHEDAR